MRHILPRRAFLSGLGGLALGCHLPPAPVGAASELLRKTIPTSGETLPAIGMGSWITFNVGADAALRAQRLAVLQTFFDEGGAVIDSSPMYGSSEEVIGYCLARIENKDALFSATKAWTYLQSFGRRQMQASEQLWGTTRFDLMQIHNLLDWEAHLETLLERKTQGRVRYIGITTSHGRRHEELEKIMASQPVDFVQFT